MSGSYISTTWSGDDIETVKRLRDEGVLTNEQIADRVGHSPSSLSTLISKLRLARRAMPKPKAEPSSDAKRRKCLRCPEMFDSEWAGNRLCSACQQHAHRMGPGFDEPYRIGSRR